MLWKRKILCAAIWIVVSVAGAVAVHELPVVYRASTLIIVESQRIPEKFVSATVSEDLKDRLNALSQQILSYRRLLEIVEKFDLYRPERQRKVQEEIIEMMRADITIQVEEGWNRRRSDVRPGAFRVAYQGSNPSVVALVANQLGNLFIEENLKAREIQAVGTSEFLDNQTAEAKKRLEEQEAKLSAFKLEHNGELPQQEGVILATLARLQVNLQSVQDGIQRAEQSKLIIDNSLEAARASLAAMSEIADQLETMPLTAAAGAGVAEGEPLKPSERLQRQLEQLRSRYTDEHPDVQALQALIPRVRQEEEAAEKKRLLAAAKKAEDKASGEETELRRDPRSMQMNQALIRERERVDNLKAQQLAIVKQIANLTAERKGIMDQIAAEHKHLQNLPIREQQLTAVMRDYEISRANYQSLLDKGLAAAMATDMERRQKAEKFTVVDPARVPEKPFKPNRPLLCGIISALGLVLGVAAALGREMRADTLLGEWELPKGVPVLGRVPVITPQQAANGHQEKRRVMVRRLALVSSLVILVAAIVAAGVYIGKVAL